MKKLFVALLGIGLMSGLLAAPANATIMSSQCRIQYKGNNPTAHASVQMCVRTVYDSGQRYFSVVFTDRSDPGYETIKIQDAGTLGFITSHVANYVHSGQACAGLVTPTDVCVVGAGWTNGGTSAPINSVVSTDKFNQYNLRQWCIPIEFSWKVKWFDGTVSAAFDPDGFYGYLQGDDCGNAVVIM